MTMRNGVLLCSLIMLGRANAGEKDADAYMGTRAGQNICG
jgi:hypothetical protein